MQTNITIDDELITQAMTLSNASSTHEVIEEALRLLVAQKRQAEIRQLRGKLPWEGDLEAMRGAPGADR